MLFGNTFGKTEARKLVAMFHFGRCGSTVVGNMLNLHSCIKWDSEVFEQIRAKTLDEPDLTIGLMGILKKRTTKFEKPIYGFECKAFPEEHLRPTLLNTTISSHIDDLIALGFRYFVLLKRKNYLRYLVSMNVGWKTNVWHVGVNSDFKNEKVHLDTVNVRIGEEYKSTIVDLFESLDRYYAEIEDAFNVKGIKYLALSYEEDVEKNPKNAYEKIVDFIGANREESSVTIKKQNNLSLQELVSNYDELQEVLKDTKYNWMLNS